MLAAHAPLRDAEWALRRLEETNDAAEFRVLWAATVALLRAVGHVLHKVDAETDAHLGRVITAWWKEIQLERRKHPIFWDFIEEERNNVLKEYRIGYVEGDVFLAADGETFTLESPIYKPLRDHRFAAEDARDIAADAVSWWNEQLGRIQSAAAAE